MVSLAGVPPQPVGVWKLADQQASIMMWLLLLLLAVAVQGVV